MMLAAENATPPNLTPHDRVVWGELIERRCGMAFSDARQRVLRQSLWARMRERGCTSYVEYFHLVARQPAGDAEWRRLLGLLLNHETCFHRHGPSFEALAGHVLPELLRSRDARRQPALRLWSAACSTGQEAYSLAIAALEGAGRLGFAPAVLGADLSPACLERARAGRYKPFEIRHLPAKLRDKYLASCGGDAGEFEVRASVRSMVRFDEFNLADPDTYPQAEQDVIFCQNVLVYLAAELRPRIVAQLAERLRPGGYLFLGPAEMVGVQCPGLDLVQLPDVSLLRRTA